MEEDGDLGHGTGKSNIVHKWKTTNHLKSYFNCAQSPDLAPIENMWQPTKQELRKYPHWDEHSTKELVVEAWDNVTMEFINKHMHSIPLRLQQVIQTDGQLAAQDWVENGLDDDHVFRY